MKKLLHTGKNLCSAQKYENAVWLLHPEKQSDVKSAAQKISEKIERLYAEWSEANEGHSRESGKLEYAKICETVLGTKK